MKNMNVGENYNQKNKYPHILKVWRRKDLPFESCNINLFLEGEKNQWYIDSRCSKHMTGYKDKLSKKLPNLKTLL